MREIKKMSTPSEKAYSQYNLAKSYESGKGMRKNENKAAHYYILAAKQGHMGAQKRLGYLYQHGIGVNQNESEAIHWYTKAAEQGNIVAHEQLIALYLKKDQQQSFYWTIRMLAQQGEAESQYHLGCYYAQGKLVKKDYAGAINWWKKAARQKNIAAQYCLAQFLLIIAEVKNRSQNLSIALYWFQQMELDPPLAEVVKLKQQGVVAIEKAESGFFSADWKSIEVNHLSTIFRQARELYFSKKNPDKEQKYEVGAYETSIKIQEFIQYYLHSTSKIPSSFKLHKAHFGDEQSNEIANDATPENPFQKKCILEKTAAGFPKDIVKCRIPVPLDFTQYDDAIIEIPENYQSDAPLLKDIPRNQSPKQLLLIDCALITESVIEESVKLASRINNTRGHFIRRQRDLNAQKAALMNKRISSQTSILLDKEQKYEPEETNILIHSIDDIEVKIAEIEKQIKTAINQQIENLDETLTKSLTDEKSPFSILAQRLGLTWAKQAICCFDQRIMYTYKFLQNLIVYLENQKLENRHKNICFALINLINTITNIYVEEDKLVFTSYLKGIRYQCMGSEDVVPRMEKQMPDCEIRVDYCLITKGANATLVPQIYTSDIKLAKQFFEAFCASQIDKIENKKSVSLLTKSFSDFSGALRDEKKLENRGPGATVKKFLLEVYRTMITELPKDLDFEIHLKNMARLSDLHESEHKYLAVCYLRKIGLLAEVNPEESSLDDLFQLYQKIQSGEYTRSVPHSMTSTLAG
jgi:hypothetical protein